MSLRSSQLRYFVAVADEGQVAGAAATLHVAAATVTQAIASLELELGFTVLKRHAQGVRLTPAGERFLTKARQALEAEMDATQTAAWLARVARGTIEFGFVGYRLDWTAPAPSRALRARIPRSTCATASSSSRDARPRTGSRRSTSG